MSNNKTSDDSNNTDTENMDGWTEFGIDKAFLDLFSGKHIIYKNKNTRRTTQDNHANQHNLNNKDARTIRK